MTKINNLKKIQMFKKFEESQFEMTYFFIYVTI
jgi:hypothetical protein